MKIIISIMILGVLSCRHDPPVINAKYWAGDSANMRISRSQEGQFILTSDPMFDDYVCTTYQEMEDIHETYIKECSVWKSEAKEIQGKLEECGLFTKKNINIVTECLDK